MSFKSCFPAAYWTAALICLGSMGSSAFAQGSYSGSWQIVAMERPAWIEPTSPDPVVAASVGDRVEFRSGGVEGSAPFACKDAQYTQLALKSSGYFGGGIPDPAVARDAADRYGLGDSAETLRVDCDAGVFDYHEGSGNLVVEFDNMVYTLKRTTPR